MFGVDSLGLNFDSGAEGAFADGLYAGSDAQLHGSDVETNDLSVRPCVFIFYEESYIKQMRFSGS